ncbi:hypothetical protein BKA67DRAFT_581832 [Truncatella angustata]|uniref:Uncharacterized protein n=1 Tax=Truncatella angustata TaxID=152316 RepID=A0A9P8RJE8_9PEZI|nr:uncharacterized protein BKA67DRAFT_581832 [Truncatella angustata]KAH6647154.1 hypothetical protein BKA67DRAFT_581832 [Truncatella angustata]
MTLVCSCGLTEPFIMSERYCSAFSLTSSDGLVESCLTSSVPRRLLFGRRNLQPLLKPANGPRIGFLDPGSLLERSSAPEAEVTTKVALTFRSWIVKWIKRGALSYDFRF